MREGFPDPRREKEERKTHLETIDGRDSQPKSIRKNKMKLVVVGGTGLVATELIRQSLRVPEITSIVALARRPVQLDVDSSSTSKFESVVVRDYSQYTDSAKAALAGADACIWYVTSSCQRLSATRY